MLERVRTRLDHAVSTGFSHGTDLPTLLRGAAADPDGFRLLFHAASEPEFHDMVGVNGPPRVGNDTSPARSPTNRDG